MNPCDEQRFTALYREHHPAVDAYVRRRLGGSPASDDVVAEVFLTAWRRLDEIPRRAVLPWLYATARRTLANAYRAERRRADLVEEVARQPHGHAADPAEGVAGQLAVAAAFEALSEADREVLRLALWEELPARQAEGVVHAGTVEDRAGRTGEAFSLTDRSGGLPGKRTLVFDPRTGNLLADEEQILSDTGKLNVEPYSVIGYVTFVTSERLA